MSRIKGVDDQEAKFLTRQIFRGAARQVGAVPDPMRLMAKSGGVLWATTGFELGIGRARSLDPNLKVLASLKAASMVGCLF